MWIRVTCNEALMCRCKCMEFALNADFNVFKRCYYCRCWQKDNQIVFSQNSKCQQRTKAWVYSSIYSIMETWKLTAMVPDCQPEYIACQPSFFPVDSVPAASKITEGKQGLKGTDPNTDGLIICYFTSYKYVSKTNLPVDARQEVFLSRLDVWYSCLPFQGMHSSETVFDDRLHHSTATMPVPISMSPPNKVNKCGFLFLGSKESSSSILCDSVGAVK